MRTGLRFSLITAFLILGAPLFSQSYHVRIGFIGNSITIGSGLSNPSVECYPSQLGLLLNEKFGDTCIITNYAVSGRTLLKKGDYPWWNEPDSKRCWNYAPDICVIMLGTNDSKPYNWDVYGDDFYNDYQSLIDTFRVRNPATKFILCLPAPAFGVVWDIRDTIIINAIHPLIDSIAKVNGTDLVDFYHPLVDSAYLFPDKIHPSAKGAKVFAKILYDEMISSDIIHQVQTGRTFITSFNSSAPNELRRTSKATLSWTTINAREVYFEGEKVDTIGSVEVGPLETTSYKLLAIGDDSRDSLILVQKVYIPEVTRITATSSKIQAKIGDTIVIKVNFYDQNNVAITDSVYDFSYSLTQGSGQFYNRVGNTVQFVADAAGTTKILCSYKGFVYTVPFTVKGFPTAVSINKYKDELSVYPNPFSSQVFISIPVEKPGSLSIKLFDSAGHLCISESRKVKAEGMQALELNTSRLTPGTYMFTLEVSGKKYSGKIIKE